jgi:hypothetical protein
LYNQYIYTAIKILIKVFLKFRLYYFVTFIFIIFCKKVCVPSNKKKIANIFVFYKSHGINDLFVNKITKNFNLYIFSRSLLKILFLNFFSQEEYINLFKKYDFSDKNLNYKKEEYSKILIKVFKPIFELLNIKIIVSFNILFPTEREIGNVAKKMGIKYLVIQKESLFNNREIKIYKNLLKKNHNKYEGDFITSYNRRYKNCLVESQFASSKQIVVTGMARLDNFFNLKNKTKNNKYYLVILINDSAGMYNPTLEKNPYNISYKSMKKWDEISLKVLKQIYIFSKKNEDAKFIFKTKIPYEVSTSNQQSFIKKNLLPNWQLIQGGDVTKLLIKCSNVIGLNTTVLLEALILKKNVIVPVLDLGVQLIKNHTIDLEKVAYIAKNKSQFNYALSKCLLVNRKISNRDLKSVLNKYSGNYDGKSSERLFNLLKKISQF